jgi:transcriptional regulator with XRE-family HTH domain
MDLSGDVRGFLVSRRERLTPQEVGLSDVGDKRRVKGLRREEVAQLTGVSVDYYSRMERGRLSGVSEAVLDALASALLMSEAERHYLFSLAQASRGAAAAPVPTTTLRPGLRWLLDAIESTPAYVRSGRFDILAVNHAGSVLFCEVFESASNRDNLARYVFLDPRSRDFFADWDEVAYHTVCALRIESSRSPEDEALSTLIAELASGDRRFATWWSSCDVSLHQSSRKSVRHPVAGDLDLACEALQLPSDPGLTLVTYVAAPGTSEECPLGLRSALDALAPSAGTTSPGPGPASGGRGLVH